MERFDLRSSRDVDEEEAAEASIIGDSKSSLLSVTSPARMRRRESRVTDPDDSIERTISGIRSSKMAPKASISVFLMVASVMER